MTFKNDGLFFFRGLEDVYDDVMPHLCFFVNKLSWDFHDEFLSVFIIILQYWDIFITGMGVS